MSTPSTPDGSSEADGEPSGDAPFLPPSRPIVPTPASEPSAAAAPAPEQAPEQTPASEPAPSAAPVEIPFLPSSRPPEPAPAPVTPEFDAKALVDSQRRHNPDPAYGAMPAGSEEGRAAARKLRDDANRKRRRRRGVLRFLGLLVIAGLAVGGYFVYQALQDDPPAADDDADDPDADDAAADGEGGALTPLGEQEQVIEVLDDLNSGARPSAGGLLDAVDDARDAVGQAEPPVAGPAELMVADVFTPAVLDHTDVLDPADGYERFVVRTADLEAINPSAHTRLVEQLLALPQVAEDDARLAVAPVVLPGDIGIAIQRADDQITLIVAVASDPPLSAVGP